MILRITNVINTHIWLGLLLMFMWGLPCAWQYQSIGEVFPIDPQLEDGSDLDMYCSLNPKQFKNQNASCLRFVEQKGNVSSNQTKVLNNTTIVLQLRNLTEQLTTYICYCDDYGIMPSKIYVGTKPKPIEDFHCLSYDFEYMICNFTQPKNHILTRNNLSLHYDLMHYTYEPDCKFDKIPYVSCNISEMYKIDEKIYNFVLTSINIFDTKKSDFKVDNTNVMILAAPGSHNGSLRLHSLTTNKLVLIIKLPPRYKGTFDWNVTVYAFNSFLKPLKNVKHHISYIRNRNEVNLSLYELPYPNWNYTLALKIKLRSAAPELWSEPLIYKFTTDASAPARPPRTTNGGFYVNSTETQVRLYWEQLADYEQNGKDFSYDFYEVWKDGQIINLSPLFMEKNSAIFSWQKTSNYTFYIRSRNEKGYSANNSIQLFSFTSSSRSKKSHTPQLINNVYHSVNRTYALTWEAPINTQGLLSYTVYWCHTKRSSSNDCEGSIHFKNVSKNTLAFTTEPQLPNQEHSLSLAVSANYENYNTGMHWTDCSMNENGDLIKMEPEVQPLNATAIQLQWSPESVCPTILSGYNLTIFEKCIQNDEASWCLSKDFFFDKMYKKSIIPNLKPFTEYKVQMFMFTSKKVGTISDALYVKTLQAAPTPPRQLQKSNITQHSALLSWKAPSQRNGIIKSYTITYNNIKIELMAPPDNQEDIFYNLTNLFSYTSYKAFVIANTVEPSTTSNDVHFTTLIGYPSKPESAQMLNDNNAIVQWSKPNNAAGRLEYYEVSITQKYHGKTKHRHISAVMSDSQSVNQCAFKNPICQDGDYTITFEVRAVNVAVKNLEIPQPGDDDEYRNEFHKSDNIHYIEDDEENSDFVCVGGGRSNVSMNNFKMYQNENLYRLYKSEWQPGPTFSCRSEANTKLIIKLLFIIIGCVLFGGLCYLLYKKVKIMYRIDIKFPLDLCDPQVPPLSTDDCHKNFLKFNNESHMTKLGKSQDKDDFHFFNNEKHHLLSAIVGCTANNDSGFIGEGPTAAAASHNALECKRSVSQSSADSLVESLNEDDNNGYQSQQDLSEELQDKQVHSTLAPNAGGYVNPNSLMSNWQQPPTILKSNLGYTPVEDLNTTKAAPMASGGYITQAQLSAVANAEDERSTMPLQSFEGVNSTNGYVQPAALMQQKIQPTAPVIAQTNLSGYTPLAQLTNIKPVAYVAPSALNATQNEANKTPAICGYVTQRELSTFGYQQNFN